jgi:hypothetical protein
LDPFRFIPLPEGRRECEIENTDLYLPLASIEVIM